MKTISFSNTKLCVLSIIIFAILLFDTSSAIFGQDTQDYLLNEDLKQDIETVQLKDQNSDRSENIQRVNKRRQKPRNDSPLTQWEIAALDGVKISTNQDAWYFVSPEQLEAFGFDINSDNTKWRLYSEEVEIPIKVNVDNSIEFYGNGDNTPDTNSKVYYLINGTSNGLRIPQVQSGNAGQNSDAENFQANVLHQDRFLYLTKILNGEAENWFGSVVNLNGVTIPIESSNLDINGQATLKVKLQGLTYAEHLVNVKINDYEVGMVSFLDKDNHEETFDVPANELNDGANEINLQAVGAGSDINLVDSISLSFPKKYEAIENKLNFHVLRGQTARVGGFSTENIRLYEIVDKQVKQQVIIDTENVDGAFNFGLGSANYDREFVAFSNDELNVPNKIERNETSSWNQTSNKANFIIISPAKLQAQAEILATRRESQRLKTKVVLTEDIADEFGFGVISPEAIRAFLYRATTVWRTKPTYVLLFGDASYDMRNYAGGENRNLVPTKLIETFDMETSSDGWLVDFDDDGVENIAIGRLPVGDVFEANKAVAKIIRYETQNLNTPKSAVLNADYLFEVLNEELDNLLPQDVASQKIERSVLGDAQMRQEIIANANSNPTFVSYLGHGTTGVWSTGNVFSKTEAESLTNEKLSFYMLMTCLNGFTHNAYGSSLAESLVLADNAAIAVWASSGSTYASGQIEMGQEVVKEIFKTGKHAKRLGDVVLISKQLSGDWDARRTWQLIGDPTLFIK